MLPGMRAWEFPSDVHHVMTAPGDFPPAQLANERDERESLMHAYDLAELLAAHEDAGDLYHEFLRVPDLSAGLYLLSAGAVDPQQPHTEDEVYYVISGRGQASPQRIGQTINHATDTSIRREPPRAPVLDQLYHPTETGRDDGKPGNRAPARGCGGGLP